MENKFFEIHTLLIDENEYKRIWDKIDSEFKFTPNGLDKKTLSIIPFLFV